MDRLNQNHDTNPYHSHGSRKLATVSVDALLPERHAQPGEELLLWIAIDAGAEAFGDVCRLRVDASGGRLG